eukprot:6202855-Pleurochrysis_carterae.AAC.1
MGRCEGRYVSSKADLGRGESRDLGRRYIPDKFKGLVSSKPPVQQLLDLPECKAGMRGSRRGWAKGSKTNFVHRNAMDEMSSSLDFRLVALVAPRPGTRGGGGSQDGCVCS